MNNLILLHFSQKIFEKGENLRVQVFGSSMFPLIRSGDIVTVKPMPPENLTVGEVLFYYKDGIFFAHRLKERSSNSLIITRGDNLPFNDNFITPSEVLGKIVTVERRGKKIDMESGLMRLVNWTTARIPIYWIIRFISFGGRIKRALQCTFR